MEQITTINQIFAMSDQTRQFFSTEISASQLSETRLKVDSRPGYNREEFPAQRPDFDLIRVRDASPTGLSCPERAQSTGLQEAPMSSNRPFGSIRKLPSGRFQIRYFHLGKRIAADSTFPTKADARAFLAGVDSRASMLCFTVLAHRSAS